VRSRPKFKVLDPVVTTLTVFVVNTLTRVQSSTEGIGHHQNMFRNVALLTRIWVLRQIDEHVTVRVCPSFAGPLTPTFRQRGQRVTMATRVLKVILAERSSTNRTRTPIYRTGSARFIADALRSTARWVSILEQSFVVRIT